jgi:hypothetical protein
VQEGGYDVDGLMPVVSEVRRADGCRKLVSCLARRDAEKEFSGLEQACVVLPQVLGVPHLKPRGVPGFWRASHNWLSFRQGHHGSAMSFTLQKRTTTRLGVRVRGLMYR